ncbi:MAG: LLM class flavin-dependent oxidoreductase [Alphaproteobacteria bacterium]|nr:LLM class flavin-dependent oxidoreductase [Alphaproteobacteria bacterium]
MHARVTREILEADRLGFDTAWIAEHHFSSQYGIMPDPYAYMGYLAAKTERIRLGTTVMTVPFYDPIRIVENTAFIDILSGGRITLGLGSGYRPYEFQGLGIDFEARRDIQEEGIGIILEGFHKRRIHHAGRYFNRRIDGEYELLPVSVQQPHPPLYMAAGTERSMTFAARHGFGLMLSTLPGFEVLAGQLATYRRHLATCPAPFDKNPAFGHVDIARSVYVAESDAKAKADTEAGILRHLAQFMGPGTAGYLGSVSEKGDGRALDYDTLAATTLIHGSPDTVIRRLKQLRAATGMTSLLLHYPPDYGLEKVLAMLRLFAATVMPEFQGDPPSRVAAE